MIIHIPYKQFPKKYSLKICSLKSKRIFRHSKIIVMIGSLKLNKAYGYTYIIKMFKNEQLKN